MLSCPFQRVLVTNIQLTVENMRALTLSLENFEVLTSNHSAVVTERLNAVSRRYTELTRADIVHLMAVLDQYEEGYRDSYGPYLDPFVFYIKYMHHIVVFLRTRVNLRESSEYTGMKGLSSAQAANQVMVKYLDNMIHLDQKVSPSGNWTPTRFWPTMERRDLCNATYREARYNYQTLIATIQKAYTYFWDMLTNWPADRAQGWPYKMDRACNSILDNNATLFNCSVEYSLMLSTARQELETVLEEIDESLALDFNFTYEDVLRNVQDDLDMIAGNLTWMSSRLQDYVQNRTTKLELSAEITTTTRDAVVQSLDTIFAKIDADALAMLRRSVDQTEFNIKLWYLAGLTSFYPMAPFIDSAILDEACRQLGIWRSPQVALNSSDWVQWQHAVGMVADSWPEGMTLAEMIDSSRVAGVLDATMTAYADTMYDEMYKRIKLAFEDAKENIVSSFDAVITDLETFRKESTITNTFIL